MNATPDPSSYPELIRGLLEPGAYPHAVKEIQVIETHISWVLLTGEYAYKVKKPVDLGFLDFSTLEARRRFCEEELRVNRRTAASLYLDVVPIGKGPDGPRVGAAPAVEFAVQMRQFPHSSRLDRCLQAGSLGLPEARALAGAIARFHGELPPREEIDAAYEVERASKPARNNFMHLDPRRFDDESQQRLAVIEAWTLQQAEALAPAFEARARGGAIRECHGDLHLENLLLRDGRFVPFDALEFNPNLRWIDVANDIAFLVMDLMARGRSDLAYSVLNGWLEQTGDYNALNVMRFYLVYRSMVRAVVTAIRQQQGGAQPEDSARPDAASYVKLAAELVDTPPAGRFRYDRGCDIPAQKASRPVHRIGAFAGRRRDDRRLLCAARRAAQTYSETSRKSARRIGRGPCRSRSPTKESRPAGRIGACARGEGRGRFEQRVTAYDPLDFLQVFLPFLPDDLVQAIVMRSGLEVLQQLQLYNAVMPVAEQGLQWLALLNQLALTVVLGQSAGPAFRLVSHLLYGDAQLVPGLVVSQGQRRRQRSSRPVNSLFERCRICVVHVGAFVCVIQVPAPFLQVPTPGRRLQ